MRWERSHRAVHVSDDGELRFSGDWNADDAETMARALERELSQHEFSTWIWGTLISSVLSGLLLARSVDTTQWAASTGCERGLSAHGLAWCASRRLLLCLERPRGPSRDARTWNGSSLASIFVLLWFLEVPPLFISLAATLHCCLGTFLSALDHGSWPARDV